MKAAQRATEDLRTRCSTDLRPGSRDGPERRVMPSPEVSYGWSWPIEGNDKRGSFGVHQLPITS